MMEFEWDLSKEVANLGKHGVSFLEAVETFHDPKGFQLRDSKHSLKEPRLYWVGRSRTGKVLTVRFTYRGNAIRIIGCAQWRKFRRYYDETTKSS